jgi:hypothetical protein
MLSIIKKLYVSNNKNTFTLTEMETPFSDYHDIAKKSREIQAQTTEKAPLKVIQEEDENTEYSSPSPKMG